MSIEKDNRFSNLQVLRNTVAKNVNCKEFVSVNLTSNTVDITNLNTVNLFVEETLISPIPKALGEGVLADSPLDGDGSIGDPLTLQTGSALADTVSFNGVSWQLQPMTSALTGVDLSIILSGTPSVGINQLTRIGRIVYLTFTITGGTKALALPPAAEPQVWATVPVGFRPISLSTITAIYEPDVNLVPSFGNQVSSLGSVSVVNDTGLLVTSINITNPITVVGMWEVA